MPKCSKAMADTVRYVRFLCKNDISANTFLPWPLKWSFAQQGSLLKNITFKNITSHFFGITAKTCWKTLYQIINNSLGP